jgi:PAS domain S-box-containing protein
MVRGPIHIDEEDFLHRIVDRLLVLSFFLGLPAMALSLGRLDRVPRPGSTVVLGLLFLGCGILWWRRRLVAPEAKLAALISLYAGIAATALFTLGLMAPGAFLLPLAVVLAWLLLPRKRAVAVTLLAVTILALAGFHHVAEGSGLEDRMGAYNRHPLFWVNLAYVLMGVTILISVTTHAVVERLRSREREARADRDRLRGILEGIQDAVFVHDVADGRILEVNRRAEDLLGYTREELLASDVGRLSAGPPSWTQAEASAWMERTRREGPQVFLWKSRRRDGSVFWTEVSMSVFPVGDEPRLLVSLRDVEERVKAREALERFNAELERRVRERTAELELKTQDLERFSSAVSHDLRSPLLGINANAEFLEEAFRTGELETAAACARDIHASGRRMGRIIDALLRLSHVDVGALRRERCDMARMVADVRAELAQAGVRDWRIDDLPACEGDPDLIRQVWANLLGNAVKYTSASEAPRIEVSGRSEGGRLWYSVRDNGEGFDMRRAQDLFLPFRRLHKGQVPGLGIGLSTVKRILVRHGGDVQAEGIPGKGATFVFWLPSPESGPSHEGGVRAEGR